MRNVGHEAGSAQGREEAIRDFSGPAFISAIDTFDNRVTRDWAINLLVGLKGIACTIIYHWHFAMLSMTRLGWMSWPTLSDSSSKVLLHF
jgi:hypothetical protein